MKNYKFLWKPIFFIFNLLFATWLVLKIEQVKPSDFGRHKHFFEPAPPQRIVTSDDKDFLRTLMNNYRQGRIDSITAEKKIEEFLTPVTEESGKELTVR